MTDWTNQLAWNGIAYGVVFIVGAIALAVLWPWFRGRWFALPRLRPGTWSGYDVFLAFCILFGIQDLILTALGQVGFFVPLIGDPPESGASSAERFLFSLRSHAVSSPLILAVILGILMPMLYARTGTRPPHYGLTWARWPAQIALGIVAFVIGRPLIIGIYALAVIVFPHSDPYAILSQVEYPGWEWAFFAFQTIVVAPVQEEVICRGILQGWLRRASLQGHLIFLTLVLFLNAVFQAGNLSQLDFWMTGFVVLLVGAYAFTLIRMARQFRLTETEIQRWQPLADNRSLDLRENEEEQIELRRQGREEFERRAQTWNNANATLAIFGSALLFAALHPSWPAALALFPMGLMLGWLYHRTQSLAAPITFHALFNAATFLALYGSILRPIAP